MSIQQLHSRPQTCQPDHPFVSSNKNPYKKLARSDQMGIMLPHSQFADASTPRLEDNANGQQLLHDSCKEALVSEASLCSGSSIVDSWQAVLNGRMAQGILSSSNTTEWNLLQKQAIHF